MSTPALAPAAAARGFSGEILTESDGSYDEARATFNALIDRRPLAIARCRSTEDVVIALAVAARARAARRCPRRRAQRRRPRRLRRRPGRRSLGARRGRGRSGGTCREGRRRRDLADVRRRRAGTRARRARRHLRDDRCRRAHARRRHRLPDRTARAHLRQPRGRRGRHRGRRCARGERERSRRPLLGAARRRRQLRRRHPARLHAPSAARGRRRLPGVRVRHGAGGMPRLPRRRTRGVRRLLRPVLRSPRPATPASACSR